MHRPEIRFPNDNIARPVRAEAGTAPFKFVTTDDAISDLPRFNWCESFRSQCSLLHRLSDDLSRIKKTYSRTNLSLSRLPAQKQNEARQRAVHIPTFECDEEKLYIGFSGAARYHDAPRTTFQAWCRENQTEDLQHFTRTLKATTVERYALPAHGKYGCTDAD
jgi:DNA (cytosine-5)-methyltransferase 1